jgi:hypothetical protein
VNHKVAGGNLAAAINQSEFQFLTFGQTLKTGTLYRTDVDENVFAAAILLDEAKTLLGVEELDRALALTNDLGWHAAAVTAAAAATAGGAKAATAACAITAAKARAAAGKAAAITTAEASATTAAAAEPVTTARKRVETFFAETIPLVATTSATTSIETHKPKRTFVSPSYRSSERHGRSQLDDRLKKPHANMAFSSAFSGIAEKLHQCERIPVYMFLTGAA